MVNYLIYTLYFLLVGTYVYDIRDNFSYMPFSFFKIFEWTTISSIWNIGLLVITTDWAKKRKIVAFFLYLPTLLVSPMLIPSSDGALNWLFLQLLFLILINFLIGEKMKWPRELRAEAINEVYKLIDKYFKKLPKNLDGTINQLADGFDDNDVDALRHAYTSGVFTQEYGETAADIFGRLNETFPGGGMSSSNSENSKNMDLWNNSIGRKYGKKSKTKSELFKKLLTALKNGELIIDPFIDTRKYAGTSEITSDMTGAVIVLDESKKGKNRIFFDLNKNLIMKKNEFVALIKSGDYSNYEIRILHGDEIPVSKKDFIPINNLG